MVFVANPNFNEVSAESYTYRGMTYGRSLLK